MSETIISPTSAAPPAPSDQGQAETFCRYLARQFVANRGYGLGTVPEADKLIAASDIVLTQNREAPFTILCLIDREADPIRSFDLSLPELEIIGRDCMKYADAAKLFGRPEISVAIRVIEVGVTSDQRWDQLKTLTSNTPNTRYHASALAVDPAKGEVRWNSRLDRPERTFIEDVLRAPQLPASPHESRVDVNSLVAIAPPSFPILTAGILALLVAVFAAETIYGVGPSKDLRPTIATLLAFGGLARTLVLQAGEWYRLLSAPFLHLDAGHLAMNAIALLVAGRRLEGLIGRAWFGSVYVISALGGSLLSLALNPASIVSVGASGAIMGLFGAMLVTSLHFPPGGVRSRLQGSAMGVLIPSLLPLANVMQGQRIDYAAHFGGAIAGAAVSLVMINVWSRSDALPRLTKAAAAIAMAGVLALAYPAISIPQHFPAASLARPQFQAVKPAPQFQAASPAPQLQALSPAPQLQAVSSDPQLKLIPPDLLPQTAANMKAQAAWLAKYFPRDPRLHLYKATELLNASDFRGAEREAHAGLAEEDLWGSMLAPEVAQNLRIMLAVALSPDRKLEALEIARPICAAVTNGPMRKILDDRKLCGA